ncbi:hypothetical protein ALI22I_11680 [Saccharothrix sp. ALI-22-I]|uniref:hypothetical protein n=1 Tax=Saccharothrix sp. ALI-22-I TaxID=1933778 RepID=UPI00097C9D5B|nr:hypothetical protein [Saccharothrix sp. ALI-22-I]ONI90754.1 hypothetical protein ALI22I_11680 [Saccharothrix sp. ALI-22-I]
MIERLADRTNTAEAVCDTCGARLLITAQSDVEVGRQKLRHRRFHRLWPLFGLLTGACGFWLVTVLRAEDSSTITFLTAAVAVLALAALTALSLLSAPARGRFPLRVERVNYRPDGSTSHQAALVTVERDTSA